jgi:hypothetical protein
MASKLKARHSARVVIVLVTALLLLWASVDARAQGKNTSLTSPNGNSSWEQAIAALQSKVDQMAATITALQTALAAETAARQSGDTTLETNVNSQAAAQAAAHTTLQGNINAQAAARQQGDADTLFAAKQYADSIVGGPSELAAAKQYADSVVQSEAAARQAADSTLQANINAEAAARAAADTTLQNHVDAEAAARQQGDADTLLGAKQYADSLSGAAALAAEIAARQAADTTLQNNINQGDASTLAAANLYTDAAVNTEAAARQAGDATLQNNIDSIQQTGGGNSGGGSVPQQLLDLAPYLSVQTGTINGLAGPHVILTGVNLHIRNAQPVQYDHTPTFPTASYLANGLGNLIIGYNDDEGIAGIRSARTGSHNLIIGDLHMFEASGGFLAGWNNYIGANASAVSGGYSNGTGDFAASVSGGFSNWAVGQGSSVSGGSANVAEAEDSTVTGGNSNHATGNYSSVAGGYSNYAVGFASSVSGGANVSANDDYSTLP